MVQQVQELIDKIKTEGVQEAESKAKSIIDGAQKRADDLIKTAQKEADAIVAKAKAEIKKDADSTRTALLQSARDMLLNLKGELSKTLERLIEEDIKEAITSDVLGDLIKTMVKGAASPKETNEAVVVSLDEKNLEALKKGFIKKLQDECKNPIEFIADEDIEAGFTISFDQGRSIFDFSLKSLVEYLSGHCNSELASLLKEAQETQEES